MLTKPSTFEELLALWESPSALSADLGLPYVSAQMMKRRGSIGAAHWHGFIEAAERKGVKLTLNDLVQMKVTRQAVMAREPRATDDMARAS